MPINVVALANSNFMCLKGISTSFSAVISEKRREGNENMLSPIKIRPSKSSAALHWLAVEEKRTLLIHNLRSVQI